MHLQQIEIYVFGARMRSKWRPINFKQLFLEFLLKIEIKSNSFKEHRMIHTAQAGCSNKNGHHT